MWRLVLLEKQNVIHWIKIECRKMELTKNVSFFCPLEMFNVLFAEHTPVYMDVAVPCKTTRLRMPYHFKKDHRWVIRCVCIHFHSHLRHNSWVHIRPSSIFHHGWWRFPHLASVQDQLMIPYWDLWIKQWSESTDNEVQYMCYLLKWQNISQNLSEKCPGHISPSKN